jgi:hypothetical protein
VSRALSRFSIIALATLFAAPAASQDAKPPAVIFSAWIKMCPGLDETCFIAKEGRSACGPVVAACSSRKWERRCGHCGSSCRSGRIRKAAYASALIRGNRLPDPLWAASPAAALRTTRPGKITRLKQGQTLVLEGIDAANAPMRMELPLAGFAEAHDGPPQELRVLEALPKEIPEAQKRAEAARRKAQCE